MAFIYFGHSRRLYDTQMEADAIKAIRDTWVNYKIVNPNTENHQRKCVEQMTEPGTEMNYFLKLSDICQFGVFLNVDMDNWTPGSTMELRYMREMGKKTYIYNHKTGKFRLVRDVPSERTFEDEHLRLYGDTPIEDIPFI